MGDMDPYVVSELVDAKDLLQKLTIALNPASSTAAPAAADSFTASSCFSTLTTAPVDPSIAVRDTLESLLSSSSSTSTYVTKGSVTIDLRKFRSKSQTSDVARLEQIHNTWQQLEYLTGNPYVRSTFQPLHASQLPSSSSSSSSTTTTTPLHHSSTKISTPSFPSSHMSPTSPSPLTSTSVNDAVELDASELKSRRLDPVSELRLNLEVSMKTPPCAESFLTQLNIRTKLASIGCDVSPSPLAFGGDHVVAAASTSSVVPSSSSSSSTLSSASTSSTPPYPSLLKLFELLQEKADQEKFFPSSALSRLSNLKSALSSDDFKSASDILTNLMKLTIPVSIPEVIRLCEATKLATGAVLKKENVIVLFGATGVGKSTIIKYLAGCDMRPVKIRTSGGWLLDHLHCVPSSSSSSSSSQVESFSTSPIPESETRFINAITLIHKGMHYVVTDTPGLDDTVGPEVEIANNKGLGDAIRGARDVRMVIVLGYDAFYPRLGSFMRLMETLAHMIPNAKDFAPSVLFLLNKVPHSELQNIISLVHTKRDEMAAAGTFTGALAHLINIFLDQCDTDNSMLNASSAPSSLYQPPYNRSQSSPIIDLANGRSALLWDKLSRVQPLPNPSASIKPFVTPSSNDALTAQLHRDVSTVHLALSPSPNLALVRFKLDLLFRLQSELKLNTVKNAYNSALLACTSMITKLHEMAQRQFLSAMSHETFSTSDFSQFLTTVLSLESLELELGIRTKSDFDPETEDDSDHADDDEPMQGNGVSGHLSEASLLHTMLVNSLNSAATSLAKEIQSSSSVLDEKVFLALHNLNCLKEASSSPTALNLSSSLQPVIDAYARSLSFIKSKMDSLPNSIDHLPLEQVAELLDSVSRLVAPPDLEPTRSSVYILLSSHATRKFESILENSKSWSALQPFSAKRESVREASKIVSSLLSLRGHLIVRLREHIQRDTLENAFQGVLANVEQYFVKCCTSVIRRIPNFSDLQQQQQHQQHQQQHPLGQLSSSSSTRLGMSSSNIELVGQESNNFGVLASSSSSSSLLLPSSSSSSSLPFFDSFEEYLSMHGEFGDFDSGYSFGGLASPVKELDDFLRDFPGLSERSVSTQAFQQMLSALFSCLMSASKMAHRLTLYCFKSQDIACGAGIQSSSLLASAIDVDSDRSAISRLRLVMEVLAEAKWLDQYEQRCTMPLEGRTRVLESMKTRLLAYCKRLKDALAREESKMTLQDYSRLSEAIMLVSRITSVSAISDMIPGLSQEIEEIHRWFVRITEAACSDIRTLIQKDRKTELRKLLEWANNVKDNFDALVKSHHASIVALSSSPLGPFSSLLDLADSIAERTAELQDLRQGITQKRSDIATAQAILNEDIQIYYNMLTRRVGIRQARRKLIGRTGHTDPQAAQTAFEARYEPLHKSILEDQELQKPLEDICDSLMALHRVVEKAIQDNVIPKEAMEYLLSLPEDSIDASYLPPSSSSHSMKLDSPTALATYIDNLEQELIRREELRLTQQFQPIAMSRMTRAFGYLACFHDSKNGSSLREDFVANVRESSSSIESFMSSYIGFITERIEADWRIVRDPTIPPAKTLSMASSTASSSPSSSLSSSTATAAAKSATEAMQTPSPSLSHLSSSHTHPSTAIMPTHLSTPYSLNTSIPSSSSSSYVFIESSSEGGTMIPPQRRLGPHAPSSYFPSTTHDPNMHQFDSNMPYSDAFGRTTMMPPPYVNPQFLPMIQHPQSPFHLQAPLQFPGIHHQQQPVQLQQPEISDVKERKDDTIPSRSKLAENILSCVRELNSISSRPEFGSIGARVRSDLAVFEQDLRMEHRKLLNHFMSEEQNPTSRSAFLLDIASCLSVIEGEFDTPFVPSFSELHQRYFKSQSDTLRKAIMEARRYLSDLDFAQAAHVLSDVVFTEEQVELSRHHLRVPLESAISKLVRHTTGFISSWNFDNLSDQAQKIFGNLSSLCEFHEAAILHSIVPLAMIEAHLATIGKALETRISGFIADLEREVKSARQIESTQEKIKKLKSAVVQLESNLGPRTEHLLSSLDDKVHHVVSHLILQAKQMPLQEWYMHSPKEEYVRLRGFDEGSQDYLKAINDNVMGLLNYTLKTEMLARVFVDNGDGSQGLRGTMVGRLFEDSKFASSPSDVYPSYLVLRSTPQQASSSLKSQAQARASAVRLYFVESAFAPLSDARLLYPRSLNAQPKEEDLVGPFEAFLLSIHPNTLLDDKSVSQITRETNYWPPSQNTSIIEDIERCLPYLPDPILFNIQNALESSKQKFHQHAEKLTKKMRDSIGNQASFFAAASKLRTDCGQAAVTYILTQMCEQLNTLHARLADALTLCDNAIIGITTTSSSSSSFVSISSSPMLPMSDIKVVFEYYCLEEPSFQAPLDAIIKRIRRTFDSIFSILSSSGMLSPLPVAIDLFKDMYIERSHAVWKSMLGYDEASVEIPERLFADYLSRSDTEFGDALKLLIGLEDTDTEKVKLSVSQKSKLVPLVNALNGFIRFTKLPSEHVLVTALSSWISPQQAIQTLFHSATHVLLKSCKEDIEGIEAMSARVTSEEKRMGELHRILLKIQVQQAIARVFVTLNPDADVGPQYQFASTNGGAIAELSGTCSTLFCRYLSSSLAGHLRILSSSSPSTADCEILTQFSINLGLLQAKTITQTTRLIEVSTSSSQPTSPPFCAYSLDAFVASISMGLSDGLRARVSSFTFGLDLSSSHPDSEKQLQHVLDAVVGLFDTGSQFPTIDADCKQKIQVVLESFSKIPNSLLRLQVLLRHSTSGSLILNSFPIFAGHLVFEFNEKTKAMTIETCLEKFRASDIKRSTDPSSKSGASHKVFAKTMQERWERFWSTYNEIVSRNIVPDPDLEKLVDEARKTADLATEKSWGQTLYLSPTHCWSSKAYDTYLPDLVATVFAVWTLSKVKYFFESQANEASSSSGASSSSSGPPSSTSKSKSKSSSDSKRDTLSSYLMKPKPSQVLAIFRLLGVGGASEGTGSHNRKSGAKFNNHLVEVKTGEGKSVTLAVTAICLALIGYKVHLACYSGHMTERDHSSFEELFEVFSLSSSRTCEDASCDIIYGTFSSLSELLLNSNFYIRERVMQVLRGTQIAPISVSASSQLTVLLIDEVDVFFSNDFYGNTYNPAALFADPTISALVKKMWMMYKTLGEAKLTFQAVKQEPEYADVGTKFPQLGVLLSYAAQQMINDITQHASPAYKVSDDGRIGYPELDGKVSHGTTCGYRTMWAHFFEHEKPDSPVNEVRRLDAIRIIARCGRFSYSHIPRRYTSVLGVTGTLSDMSSSESEIIKEFGINTLSYSPSMYGASELEWSPDRDTTIIFKKPLDTDDTHLSEFFLKLHNLIKAEMEVDAADAKRERPGAVLIFFENDKILQSFMDSEYGKRAFLTLNILDPDMNANLNEIRVRDATRSGAITIMNRSIGRGTDFSCHDAYVFRRGGVLVIQTFLSLEKSEETQIKGRTARQGQPGRYRLVLRSDQLEEVGVAAIVVSEMKQSGVKYNVLDEARNELFRQRYKSNRERALSSNEEHSESVAFLEHLRDAKLEEVMAYLHESNRGYVPHAKAARVLILLQACSAMFIDVQTAKNTVYETFRRLKTILKEHYISENAFKVQYAVYRNYKVPHSKDLLDASGWHSEATSLEKWLARVRCYSGIQDGAVEVALKLANDCAIQIAGLESVVLMSAAPPNPTDKITTRRALFSPGWKGTPFEVPVFLEEQLKALVSKGVPVHTIATNSAEDTAKAFKSISQATGGQYQKLDFKTANTTNDHANSHDALIHIVSTHILSAIASCVGCSSATLIDAYRAKDWKSSNAQSSS